MDLAQYGPFAATIAVAAALAASFSLLLVKSVGRLTDWAWLGGGAPPVLLSTAAKSPAFALIVLTFITITRDNYLVFVVLSGLSGILVAYLAIRLQHHRVVHVVSVPETASDGSHKQDADGKPVYRSVVIGTEADMLPHAAGAYAAARANDASLTLPRFMSGYATPNDPAAIWSPQTLATVRDHLCMFAMATILAAVMSLYLAASAAEAAMRPDVPQSASPPQPATTPQNGSDAAAHLGPRRDGQRHQGVLHGLEARKSTESSCSTQ